MSGKLPEKTSGWREGTSNIVKRCKNPSSKQTTQLLTMKEGGFIQSPRMNLKLGFFSQSRPVDLFILRGQFVFSFTALPFTPFYVV